MNSLLAALLFILSLFVYLNIGFGLRKFGIWISRDENFLKFFFVEDFEYAWALAWPIIVLLLGIFASAYAIVYALMWILVKLSEIMRSIALFKQATHFFGKTIGYLFLGKMWKK